MEFNLNFLERLAEFRNPAMNFIVHLMTKLGEEIVIFGVICLFYWCINKHVAYRIGFIFFGSGLAVQGLKITFRIERPWILDSTLQPVESALEKATGYSFPSGHTQSAGALYGGFAWICKKLYLKIIFICLILMVAFSRLYLGVHTPLDVVTSIGVSVVFIFLVNAFYERLTKTRDNDLIIAVILAFSSVALCVYSVSIALSGYAPFSQINDCVKSGGAGLGFALGWYLERRYLNFDTMLSSKRFQALKFIIGVGGALILKELPKIILPGNAAFDFIRYFCVIFWVIYVYPLLFTKFIKSNKSKAAV